MTAVKSSKKKEGGEVAKAAPYWYAVGRRKTSIAQVRVYLNDQPGTGEDIVVNGRPFVSYFPILSLQSSLLAPFKVIDGLGKFSATVKVVGGGIKSQMEATRLGIARALVLQNEGAKKPMRAEKLLTRDSRIVERKKPGLKKARKAPQWAKR